MFKRYIIPLLFWLVSSQSSIAGSPCDNLRITEMSSNQVLLFGVEVELEDLSEAIRHASENSGAIFFYRENESEGQTALSNKIIELAIEHQISIKMSKKPDFSDVLYKYGNARP